MTERLSGTVAGFVVGRKQNGRCICSREGKRALVEECLQPGVSVARLALTHGVNANLLRSFRRRLAAFVKISVIIIDDFAISPLTARNRNDLLELLDDRVGSRSTILTSQLPPQNWHDYIGDPTLADAILDRLLHNAHTIKLEGESIRKRAAARANKIIPKSIDHLTDRDRSL